MHIRGGTYAGSAGGQTLSLWNEAAAPELLLIHTSGVVTYARTRTMPADSVKQLVGAVAFATGGITALTATGFTLGTSVAGVNAAATTFYWTAFFASPLGSDHGGCQALASYAGTGSSNARTGAGFAPGVVIIVNDGANGCRLKTTEMGTNVSASFDTATNTTSITSLDADGFTVGSGGATNAVGTNYYAVCFKNVALQMKTAQYTSTAGNLAITGIGFAPTGALVKLGAVANTGAWHPDAMSAANGAHLGTAADAATFFAAFGTDGLTLGTNTAVQASTNVGYLVAWRNVPPSKGPTMMGVG